MPCHCPSSQPQPSNKANNRMNYYTYVYAISFFLFVGIFSNANALEQPISHVRGSNKKNKNNHHHPKDPLIVSSMHHDNNNDDDNNNIHRELMFGLGIESCQANLATCQEKTATSTRAANDEEDEEADASSSSIIIERLQASLTALMGEGLEDSSSDDTITTAIQAALTSAAATDFSAIATTAVTTTTTTTTEINNIDAELLLQLADELPAAITWTEKPNGQQPTLPQQGETTSGTEPETTTEQNTPPFGDFYGTVLIKIETILNTLIKSLDVVYSVGLSPLTDFITAVRKIVAVVPTGGIELTTTILNEVIEYVGKFIVYIVGITVAARSSGAAEPEAAPEAVDTEMSSFSNYTSCVSAALACEFDLVMMNAIPALVGEAYLVQAMKNVNN